MKLLRYHIINILAVILFSYTVASTVNGIIRFILQPEKTPSIKVQAAGVNGNTRKEYSFYSVITENNFFKIPRENTPGTVASAGSAPEVNADNLVLLGTITGAPVITRAMIMKKGEKNAGIYALWKINDEIGNDVYGYKLVRIEAERVVLENSGQRTTLILGGKTDNAQQQAGTPPAGSTGDVIRQTVSRAEIKQQVLNNLDNASKGLVVSPYRENGEVVGYRLKKVRPYNILYKYGIRSGDTIRRINGHAMNSIEKLYKMWENLQNESRIVLDVERDGKNMTFDLVISD